MAPFCFLNKKILARLIVVLVLTVLVWPPDQNFLLAATLSKSEQRERAELQEELDRLEEEKAKLEETLAQQKSQSASIQGDINILSSQIYQAELNIKKKNLEIERLSGVISLKKQTIEELEEEMADSKVILAELLRRKKETDSVSLPEVLLVSDNLSDFFSEIDSHSSVNKQLQNLYHQVQEITEQTMAEKEQLTAQQAKELDAKYVIQTEKQVIDSKKQEKNTLLNISKQSEATYQDFLTAKEIEIAKIRSQLIRFEGSGVEARSISFGEAYDYAKAASGKTGVRTAFIMAIMQQESGFGRNVGGCYLLNGETGDGIYINSGEKSIRNMVPGNFDNFVEITDSLGRDWKSTPISCVAYYNGKPYGYGGAMGYTQFIPNTWMLVEARVRSYLGIKVANPWNAQDAVMATAVFLQDLGAALQTYSAEYRAACRYYGSCSIHDYGTSVMQKAINIQITIDKLES
ncbi:MAG TPA: lytic murein transglycosylase [Candidatus Paceibacterota bacterium]|nr:lytic murein transglycosylase [Candidatus Paceibacterota bacterium]HRZ34365.1 lytic murein transglycosylase [Candidatus Paceibacterota bacterium]